MINSKHEILDNDKSSNSQTAICYSRVQLRMLLFVDLFRISKLEFEISFR